MSAPYDNFGWSRTDEELPPEQLRSLLAAHLHEHPEGQSVDELLSVFRGLLRKRQVQTALKHADLIDPQTGMPPVNLRASWGGRVWKYPDNPAEVDEYLRSHLSQTIGDINSMWGMALRARSHFGSRSLGQEFHTIAALRRFLSHLEELL